MTYSDSLFIPSGTIWTTCEMLFHLAENILLAAHHQTENDSILLLLFQRKLNLLDSSNFLRV
jgi:hypothetical protein